MIVLVYISLWLTLNCVNVKSDSILGFGAQRLYWPWNIVKYWPRGLASITACILHMVVQNR